MKLALDPERFIASDGVNLSGVFDPAVLSKEMQEFAGMLGITDKVPLKGSIGGFFKGNISLELTGRLPDFPANNVFKFLKPAEGSDILFFLKYSLTDKAFGFRTDVILPDDSPGGKPKIMTTDFAVGASLLGTRVYAAGDIKGEWENAIGIKGFTLRDPGMGIGITSSGAFDISLKGTAAVGKEYIAVAGNIVSSVYSPQALALAGEISTLPLSEIANITNGFSIASKGKKIKEDKKSNFEICLKEVGVLFMSPGSKLPKKMLDRFKISDAGMGMAYKGKLYINKNMMGIATGSATPEGYSIYAEVNKFEIGAMKVNKGIYRSEASITAFPSTYINFDYDLFGGGAKQKYVMYFGENGYKLVSYNKIKGFFNLKFSAQTLKGFEMSPANDFLFELELGKDTFQGLNKAMGGAIEGMQKDQKNLKKSQKDLNSAEKAVKSQESLVKSARKKVTKERDKNIKKVKDAEKKVKSLKNEIKKQKNNIKKYKKKRKKCKWYEVGKKAKYTGKIIAAKGKKAACEVAKAVAETTLKAVRKLITLTPVDLDPRVAGPLAALETAKAGLKAAQAAVQGVLEMNKAVLSAAEAVKQGSKDVQIEKVSVGGTVKGLAGIKGSPAPKFKMKVIAYKKPLYFEQSFSAADGAKQLEAVMKPLLEKMAVSVQQEIIKNIRKHRKK